MKRCTVLLAFKILLIGESGVGKTTLLRTLKYGYFIKCGVTVGLDFTIHYVKVNDITCKLVIWDFGGYRNFMRMYWENPHFVSGAHGVLLAFDISSYETFLALEDWLKLVRKYNSSNISIILVGMKADLPRRVPRDEILKFIRENQLNDYIETSALSMINVEKPFERIVEAILEKEFVLKGRSNHKRSKIIEQINP
ncbi:MAG: Rab family GTPase [Candidatus Baldrarchaeia archaeon]